MGKRARVQLVLTLMPGPEPWLRVEHSRGWFKVPADVAGLLILQLASEGCVANPKKPRRASSFVRISAEHLAELQAQAAGGASHLE